MKATGPHQETLLSLFAEGVSCTPGEECGVDLTVEDDSGTVILGYN